jgi:cation diffusion facilitator family transporter
MRNSPALIAGAIDHRSDVYASLLAAAGIGVALVGTFFHQPLFYYADPIAGILVAVIVIVIGFRLIRDSSISLMDVVVDNEEKSAVFETIAKVTGVMRIDDLRMRTNGSYFLVDVKIGVDPSITVLEGHAITKQVKSAVLDGHPRVYDILVHVNPYFAD